VSAGPKLRLVPIDRSGVPAEDVAERGELAAGVCAATARFYDTVGWRSPWVGYLVVSNEHVVGACSFKGPPAAGKVEIAYFTFPEFEGRGLATAMAQELLLLAERTEPGVRVTAQTLPQQNASTRILEKLGFERAGKAIDLEVGEVWEWELPKRDDAGR
jgi:RimJ/RimL family protein N-acetyltransferase